MHTPRRAILFSLYALCSAAVVSLFMWGYVTEGRFPGFDPSTSGPQIWLIYLAAFMAPWLVHFLTVHPRGPLRLYGIWTILVAVYLLFVLYDDSLIHLVRKLPVCLLLAATPWILHYLVKRAVSTNTMDRGAA